MNDIFQFICQEAHHADILLFTLLMLAGLNVPFSEDLIVLTAGAIVSTCIPDQYWHLYLWILAGCWISAWEAYWIGRLLGPQLYNIKWFNWAINEKRIATLSHYYEKFGIFTFIIGRFFPGGVRNALFMTAGMSKMPFLIFIMRDGVAAVISSSFLFYLGYIFGQNYDLIVQTFIRYNKIFISCLLIIVIFITLGFWLKKNKNNTT